MVQKAAVNNNKKKPLTIPATTTKKSIKQGSRNGVYAKKNLAEELVLEIARSTDNSDEEMPMVGHFHSIFTIQLTLLQKCSLDSGISMVASPVKDSEALASLEERASLDSGIGPTRFAQSVAELVEYVSKVWKCNNCVLMEVYELFKKSEKKAQAKSKSIQVKTVTDAEQRQPISLPLVLERVTPFERKVEQSERSRIYKLLPRDIEFCTYMMEKYGENFQVR